LTNYHNQLFIDCEYTNKPLKQKKAQKRWARVMCP